MSVSENRFTWTSMLSLSTRALQLKMCLTRWKVTPGKDLLPYNTCDFVTFRERFNFILHPPPSLKDSLPVDRTKHTLYTCRVRRQHKYPEMQWQPLSCCEFSSATERIISTTQSPEDKQVLSCDRSPLSHQLPSDRNQEAKYCFLARVALIADKVTSKWLITILSIL